MIGVHISQFTIDKETYLVFASLFLFSDVSGDNALGFLTKSWITIHLNSNNEYLDLKPSPHIILRQIIWNMLFKEIDIEDNIRQWRKWKNKKRKIKTEKYHALTVQWTSIFPNEEYLSQSLLQSLLQFLSYKSNYFRSWLF